jgi:two-component system, NarL family, nitrate/nitrite response regulator NarL
MKVMIADDHPLFRMGLRYALTARGFEVVGEATDGLEALIIYAQTQPQVALLDIKMPNMDGIEACKQLMAQNPKLIVVLLTTFSEPAIVEAARKAGAKGFLSKETEPLMLAEALDRIAREPDRDWLPISAPIPQFTPREQDVLKLLLEGQTNKRIALRLGLSPDTVKDYVSRVLSKLEVSDRMGALRKARELGLG